MPKPSSKAPAKPKVLAKSYALRYAEGSLNELEAKLKPLGEVQVLEEQHLLLLRNSQKTQAQLLKLLKSDLEEGTVGFITPILQDTQSQCLQIPTNEITVRFKQSVSEQHLKSFTDQYGLTVVRQNEFVPQQYTVQVAKPTGLRALEVANQLQTASEVEFATPNYISQYKR